MSNEIYIDGILQTWGERLFSEPVKSKTRATKAILKAPKKKAEEGGSAKSTSANSIRQKLKTTTKRVPEVVVKITGSGKNIKRIKAHMDYISRNGEVELEDQDGQIINGRDAVRDLRDDWRDGKHVIPTEEGTQRESFNIVLSMPAGTNRSTVTDAVRDFAEAEFGGKHDYVFAQHDDQPQSHVHLLVKARDYDGKRMNPRKADLQSWREKFADKLRERGIEANATKRPTRGIIKKPANQKQHWTEKKGTKERYFPDKRPSDPFASATAATHQKVLRSYKEVATALASSAEKEDLKLAKDIVSLVSEMPIVKGQGRVAELSIEKGPNQVQADKEK